VTCISPCSPVDRLKADKDLVRDVYSAAKKLKLERVRQVCTGIYMVRIF